MKTKKNASKKITIDSLNPREIAVVRYLAKHGALGLADITVGARRYKGLGGAARRTWWVRNAVRKPLAAGFVARVDAGTYRSTPKGRKAVAS